MIMEIQNIANFFMFNGYFFWNLNFNIRFSFSWNKWKKKYSACISFYIFVGKMKNELQGDTCDFIFQ